jgi:hypothetical protein
MFGCCCCTHTNTTSLLHELYQIRIPFDLLTVGKVLETRAAEKNELHKDYPRQVGKETDGARHS